MFNKEIINKNSDVKERNRVEERFSDAARRASEIKDSVWNEIDLDSKVETASQKAREISKKAWDDGVVAIEEGDRKAAERLKTVYQKLIDLDHPERVSPSDMVVGGEDDAEFMRRLQDGEIDLKEITATATTLEAFKFANSDTGETLKTDAGITKELYALYSKPEFLKWVSEEYDVSLAEAKNLSAQFVDQTLYTAKAMAYLSEMYGVGALNVPESVYKSLYASFEKIRGNDEHAEEIMLSSYTEELAKYINDNYEGSDFIKKMGDASEKFGEFSVDLGLAILAMGPGAAGALGVGLASLTAGSETLKNRFEKDGELTYQDLATAAVVGAGTGVMFKIAKGMKYGSKAIKETGGKVTNEVKEVVGPIQNKAEGLAREELFEKKLLKEFSPKKGYEVIREAYLRDSSGNIVKDAVTETARRIDFVVKQGDEIVYSFEVTSPTAEKAVQMAKESRIMEAGGRYIKDNAGNLVKFADGVSTVVERIAL